MTIQSSDLIALYALTLEEQRHQEKIYVQAFIGLAILIPVFFAAVRLLVGDGSPLRPEYVTHVKVVALASLAVLLLFFWVAIFRIDRRFHVCRCTLASIHAKLKEMPEGGSELSGLLIAEELYKPSFDTWMSKYRLPIYVALSALTLPALWFVLFVVG